MDKVLDKFLNLFPLTLWYYYFTINCKRKGKWDSFSKKKFVNEVTLYINLVNHYNQD